MVDLQGLTLTVWQSSSGERLASSPDVCLGQGLITLRQLLLHQVSRTETTFE